jgi:thioredoxin 1
MLFGRKRVKAAKLETVAEIHELAASGRPVLIDFMQVNCAPCKVMDGIVDELAQEFQENAHVVKINVAHVPGAAQAFGVKSTPTFIVLGVSPKARKRAAAEGITPPVSPRWRATGLVKKDVLRRAVESNLEPIARSQTP